MQITNGILFLSAYFIWSPIFLSVRSIDVFIFALLNFSANLFASVLNSGLSKHMCIFVLDVY